MSNIFIKIVPFYYPCRKKEYLNQMFDPEAHDFIYFELPGA